LEQGDNKEMNEKILLALLIIIVVFVVGVYAVNALMSAWNSCTMTMHCGSVSLLMA